MTCNSGEKPGFENKPLLFYLHPQVPAKRTGDRKELRNFNLNAINLLDYIGFGHNRWYGEVVPVQPVCVLSIID